MYNSTATQNYNTW